jgi:hypothetical protein
MSSDTRRRQSSGGEEHEHEDPERRSKKRRRSGVSSAVETPATRRASTSTSGPRAVGTLVPITTPAQRPRPAPKRSPQDAKKLAKMKKDELERVRHNFNRQLSTRINDCGEFAKAWPTSKQAYAVTGVRPYESDKRRCVQRQTRLAFALEFFSVERRVD